MPKISVGESFTVALISGMAKVRMREGEYQEFPSKTFCLTVPNNFRNGDPFSVSLISGIEMFMLQRVMSRISIFCRNFFCLTVPDIFVCEPFSVSLFSGTEKFWIRGGGVIKNSGENFLSHSAENFRSGNPSVFL